MLTAIRHPWETRDMEAALAALGLAFSRELCDSPEFESLVEQLLPLFPQTETQIRTTCEQLAGRRRTRHAGSAARDWRAHACDRRRTGCHHPSLGGSWGRRAHPARALRAFDRAGFEPRADDGAGRRLHSSRPRVCAGAPAELRSLSLAGLRFFYEANAGDRALSISLPNRARSGHVHPSWAVAA